jgi:hypothetical protein
MISDTELPYDKPVWTSETHLIMQTGDEAFVIYKRVGTSHAWERIPKEQGKWLWYRTLENARQAVQKLTNDSPNP